MNVFLRELRAYRGSTITWVISLSSILVVFMALYPAFTADVAVTRQVFEQFPAVVMDALNISLASFFTIFGFFGYLLSFAILAGSIQAMNLGTGIISKETSGKTADFLLTKPVTRSRVVTAKLGAALALLILTNLVFATVAYAVARVMSEEAFSARTFLVMASTLFLVQLFFLALGALFAVTIPRIKSVVAVSLPTVFAFYIVGVVGDVVANDEAWFLTPFKYFETEHIIANSSLATAPLIVLSVFVVVTIGLSYLIYVRKDVRASA
ncbi:ABC transporter permease subunit [Tessaracoccus sp. MC1679]|uniref:ABC transporter permease subunit n=1 Tax=Tessaracoccus sp. MC1679 TaxID=2760313 RepID=UPI0016042728|nr:ABC transporter permease subunit [Tessaracoccus sp. MC1679]